jgi:hypothetical protein
VKHFAILHDAEQGHEAMQRAWSAIKPHLRDGRRFELRIKDETRNSEQNALLHAELSDIARSVPWAGSMRDIETWKRLMTAAWLRARGEQVEFLPALDGHGVDVVFRHTSELTKAECAELIDYIQAWKAEHMEAQE